MHVKALISFLAVSIILLISTTGGTGCANIMQPEGGLKDTLAPVLVKSLPQDSSLNFSGNKITLLFDEYINLENIQQELIVSPVPAIQPVINRKLKEITIKLRDSLEANTTYSINFGNAIKDVNEANPFRKFTYIFSTGSFIDSLQFRGKVILAETGEVDSTLTIMLHRSSDDSAVIKDRPRYISKPDKRGDFVFKNLPPGTFYLYALKDEGGNYAYRSAKQLFAFADTAVQVGRQTAPVTLYAYVGEKTPPAAPPANTNTGAVKTEKRLKFQTTIRDNKQDLLEKLAFIFDVPLKTFDSTKIRFVTDTLFTPVTGYHWETDSLLKTVKLNYNWQEKTLYHFILEKDFATDTLGQQLLKADTFSFTTKAKNEYGKLFIRFRNLDLSKNPVLLMLLNNEIKKSFPLTSTTLQQDLFLPGEYSLRILFDNNSNGKWDAGEFFGKHLQPEIVKPLARKISIRANSAVPVEVDVNAIPAEVPDATTSPVQQQQQRRATPRPRSAGRPSTNVQ